MRAPKYDMRAKAPEIMGDPESTHEKTCFHCVRSAALPHHHLPQQISNKHRTTSFAGLEVAALIAICVIQVFTIRQ